MLIRVLVRVKGASQINKLSSSEIAKGLIQIVGYIAPFHRPLLLVLLLPVV